MRTVMGNEIPADKQEEIREIIKCIEESKDQNGVKMMILFGSYTRGQGVEHRYKDKTGTTYEYKSDFDLLVIMESEKKAKNNTMKNIIRRKIKRNEKIKTPVSVIFHGIEHVNEQIKNRSYFFLDIYREGIMLYDTKELYLEEPLSEADLPRDVRLAKASFYYEKWFKSSDGFLFGFETYYKVKNFNLAVFNLHQTAEHLYMGILLVLIDYKPKSHDLIKLNQEIIGHDIRFEEVFPYLEGSSLEV